MKLTLLVLCCTAVVGGASSLDARAQSQPGSVQLPQIVRLVDGSIYQGDLVELVPSDHLTLRLATGEIKRFTWSEIQHSALPGAAAVQSLSGSLPGLSSSMPAPLGPQSAADTVQLHFRADDPQAVLFSIRATGGIHFNSPGMNFDPLFSDWTMVCPRAPCDVTADRRLIYEVQGPLVVRSLPFTLPQGPGVTVDAQVAHQGTRTFFTLASVLGGAAAVAGMVLLTVGGVQDTTAFGIDPMATQKQQDALDRQHRYFIAGGVLMGGGALLLITGIVGSIFTRTAIKFHSDGQLALRLPGKAVLDLAALRVRF